MASTLYEVLRAVYDAIAVNLRSAVIDQRHEFQVTQFLGTMQNLEEAESDIRSSIFRTAQRNDISVESARTLMDCSNIIRLWSSRLMFAVRGCPSYSSSSIIIKIPPHIFFSSIVTMQLLDIGMTSIESFVSRVLDRESISRVFGYNICGTVMYCLMASGAEDPSSIQH